MKKTWILLMLIISEVKDAIMVRKSILSCLLLIVIFSGCATLDHYAEGNAYYDRGEAYYKVGNYDAAIEDFKEQVTHQQGGGGMTRHSYIYTRIGDAYQKKHQYKTAVFYFQKTLAMGADWTSTFAGLAECYNKLNQYNNAIKTGTRGIEVNFNNDRAHFELAYAFFKTKQYKNAVKAYKKAIELNPGNPTHYNRWGDLLVDRGDYAGAAEQYEKAVSLNPYNLKYLSDLYIACYWQGRYDNALDAADKTVLLLSFAEMGVDLQIVENYPVVTSVSDPSPVKKAGIKAGDKIIKVDGKTIKGWKLNDVISDIKGQEGTSVVFLIERKDTKNPLEIVVIRENIIQEEASKVFGIRSRILRRIGKKQESLKDAKQAYSLNSSGGEAQLALGVAYLDQGRYDEVIKLLLQVDSAETRLVEATAYAKKGDFKRAVDIYSSIPEEELSQKNVPLWRDRAALFKALKPFIASKMESAGRLKTQGSYKEALKALSEVMKIADDKTSEEICGSIYRIMSMDPRLSELPEEARKYTLRGVVLTEEGNFEDAVKEYCQAVQAAPYIAKLYLNTAMVYGELKRYPQAIRNMKTYLGLAPEAPNARAAKDQLYKWEFMMEKGE